MRACYHGARRTVNNCEPAITWMNWTGKLIGALLGLILTRRPLGVLIGLILGHLYDLYVARVRTGPRADPALVRTTFFRTAFGVMGHVAKADGRVSEQDIAAARRIFRQLGLSESDTRAAMECYTHGKSPAFDADAALAELAAVCRGREEVLRVFLEIQMRAALLGDGLDGPARAALMRIASALGIGALEYAHIETVVRLQAYAAGHREAGARPRPPPGRDALAEAYEVLEVPSSATNAEVKRSYRRLMNANHPDKLVARGLPESMLEAAKQRTQAIQAAWERVREARGMR